MVFEEDVGFLGALRDLRRGAKCPVVLTAESYRHEYAPLACNIWYLPRPRLVEVRFCRTFLCVVINVSRLTAEREKTRLDACMALARSHDVG